MTDDKKQPRLFGWRQGVLISTAALAGVGLNGYRKYRAEGGLDTTWFVGAIATIVILGGVIFFFARHANRPEKEK